MSNSPEKKVPYHTGNSDMQAVLWGSAHILDSQPVIKGEPRKVEWTDDQGRECELTGRTGNNRYHIREVDKYYGVVHYIFNRQDQTGTTKIIIGGDETIRQSDGQQDTKPVHRRAARKLITQSMRESYEAANTSLKPIEGLDPALEDELFADIVDNSESKGVIRGIGRAVKNLFIG